jgi:rubrerythrin
MAAGLSLEDLLHVAERVERRGAEFYRRATETCPDTAGQRTFAKLATMEAEHEAVFAAIRQNVLKLSAQRGSARRLPARVRIVFDVLIAGLMEDLRLRFTDKVFTGDILREALAFEKDTIIFFTQLAEGIDNPGDRKKVQMVLREELSHLCTLSEHLVGERPRTGGPTWIQALA